MRYYRCYLLDAKYHIATAIIIKAADDDDAKRQSRERLAADAGRYHGLEVWECARWIYSYPSEAALAKDARRRRGDAIDQDVAIADVLSAEITRDRRTKFGDDAVKRARLRELRLEYEAENANADSNH